MPIETSHYAGDDCGTEVTLSALDQHLNFPSPERLRERLVIEYGREEGFTIFVNGTVIGIEDVRGAVGEATATLPVAGSARLRLRTTEDQQPAKQSGIALRVGGKIIGKPSYFGLDQLEDIPPKLLRRVYGEVEADGLLEDLTADGFNIIESSKAYSEVEKFVQDTVKAHLQEKFTREMTLAKARLQQEIDRSLAKMPEHRREYARRAIEKIMQRFYQETEERIRPIISVVLDALERDEYWQVLDRIDQAHHRDVGVLAGALREFGVLELGMIAQQARRRLALLDDLDALISKPDTREYMVHTALGTNLWIFGPEFALMSSNRTLASIIEAYTDSHFTGERASKRPDLLLLSRFSQKHVLIEFKRPSVTIDRLDVSQAEQYRDDLIKKVAPIEMWVIGGSYDTRIPGQVAPGITITSYAAVISRARAELDWLLEELTNADSAAV